MLEEFTRAAVEKIVAEDYPHIKLPAVVYATVKQRESAGEWNKYTLTILDRFGNRDESFPVIPGVMSKMGLEVGRTVAVALAYGDLTPIIIGEVAP